MKKARFDIEGSARIRNTKKLKKSEQAQLEKEVFRFSFT
jgi:hypothetical protein